MSAVAGEVKTCRLSRRLSVTITASRLGVTAEWAPRYPDEGLTPGELKRYRAARDEVLQRLAGRLGMSIAVVEV